MPVFFQAKKHLWAAIFLVFALENSALLAQSSSGSVSPYVKLYESRWKEAKQKIELAHIKFDFNTRLLNRYRPLLESSVISKQKFEEQSIQVELAKLEVKNMQAKAAEAQSLYEVNKLRIDNGLDVSICPEGE